MIPCQIDRSEIGCSCLRQVTDAPMKIGFRGIGRNRNNRNRFGFRVFFELLEHLVSADVGQQNVGQDNRRFVVTRSFDTLKAGVARQALDAGADMVNDISALGDPGMLPLVVERGAPNAAAPSATAAG